MLKIIVAGGRDFSDYNRMIDVLDNLFARYQPKEIEIVCGEAKGADSLGKRYAKEHGCAIKSFPADWKKNGKAAGPIRNEEMAVYADAAVVFWDCMSKGSLDMINRAKAHNLKLRVIKYIPVEKKPLPYKDAK